MMSCVTIFLTSTMAGLNPGTCALDCLLDRALIVVSDHETGHASMERGIWFKVYRVNGEWRWIVEQETAQCREGGVQW